MQVNLRLLSGSSNGSLVEGMDTELREMAYGGMDVDSYSPDARSPNSLETPSSVIAPKYNIGTRVFAKVPNVRM